MSKSANDKELALKITAAIRDYDVADGARKDKAIAAGTLLAEAHKRHPTRTAFEKFLATCGDIQIRRAETLIAMALGRKDFEKHQIDNSAAQQRHRDKLKAEKIARETEKLAKPKAEPKLPPLRDPQAEAIMRRAAEDQSEPEPINALRNASAAALREFMYAARTYLPRLNDLDLKKARMFVTNDEWRSAKKDAA